MDILIVATAVLSVVNLILLAALFFRKEKPAPKEDDRLNDVRQRRAHQQH